jgi:arylsulfatase A-like enzyme
MTEKPNILFLFADDQRFDTINALGNKEILTPNIDKLVQRGTSYSQAHIPSGTSPAVCMPSRAMLHTGRNLFSIEKEGQSIDKNHALMGETLKNNGYITFGTGKWHNGTDSYRRSFTQGGDIFFGGMDDHWNVPVHAFDPTGKYEGRLKKVKDYHYSNVVSTFISNKVTPGKHSTELFSEATIDFINKQNADNPFFAYVSFMAPHDPRTMPKEFLDMYDADKIEVPKNFLSSNPIEYANVDCRDEVLASYPRIESEIKVHIAEYYAMITHLDHEIGKIIKTLEDKGLLENTIIVFTADNGLALGQHGLMGKQCHYDHSIRVPFVLAGPGIPENQIREEFIYLFDIFPTFCEMLDIATPDSVQGISFFKGIWGQKYNNRKDLYFAYTDKIRSVKNSRYKLMQHVHKGRITTQLFDFIEDPLEMANIIEQEKYKEVVGELKELMRNYNQDWKDDKHPLGESYWTQYNTIMKQENQVC